MASLGWICGKTLGAGWGFLIGAGMTFVGVMALCLVGAESLEDLSQVLINPKFWEFTAEITGLGALAESAVIGAAAACCCSKNSDAAAAPFLGPQELTIVSEV